MALQAVPSECPYTLYEKKISLTFLSVYTQIHTQLHTIPKVPPTTVQRPSALTEP
jgi:hypothetical protein